MRAVISIGLVARVLAVALGMFVATCAPAWAGPPYETDDPEPTAYRHYEIYVFGTYDNDASHTVDAGLPSLEINYGLMPNVQFSVTAPFGGVQAPGIPFRAGYGDTEVALKVRFMQEAHGRPQASFYPAIELPTGHAGAGLGAGLPKVFLPIWGQKTNGSWTFFGGGGVWHNPGAGNRDYTFTGIAATHDVRDGLNVGGEIYHQSADTAGGSDSTGVGVGVIAARGEHHAFLVSVGRGIHGTSTFHGYAAYELYLGPRGAGSGGTLAREALSARARKSRAGCGTSSAGSLVRVLRGSNGATWTPCSGSSTAAKRSVRCRPSCAVAAA